MSYIFIDVEAARRCVREIRAKAEAFRGLIAEEADATGMMAGRLEEYCNKVLAMAKDLSQVTEAYAAEDERLKTVHLMNNEGGRVNNG